MVSLLIEWIRNEWADDQVGLGLIIYLIGCQIIIIVIIIIIILNSTTFWVGRFFGGGYMLKPMKLGTWLSDYNFTDQCLRQRLDKHSS